MRPNEGRGIALTEGRFLGYMSIQVPGQNWDSIEG